MAEKGYNEHLKTKLSPEFGPWLRRARQRIPMTIDEFSARTGIARGTITAIELNREPEKAFAVGLFVRLAEGLGMELGYLLHQAGLDIGRDGVNLGSLRRVEEAVDAFIGNEHDIRFALAEAQFRLKDKLGDELARALGALDMVCERMRREGFAGQRPRVVEDKSNGARWRAWTTEEMTFLRANPSLSHEEAGRELGRTSESVRYQRDRMKEEVAA